MRILGALLIILASVTGCSREQSPELEASLLDIRLTSPDDRWEYYLRSRGLDFQQLKKDTRQLEVDFAISNRYQKEFHLFGVYSKRLNSLALGIRGVNYNFPEMLPAGIRYVPDNILDRYVTDLVSEEIVHAAELAVIGTSARGHDRYYAEHPLFDAGPVFDMNVFIQ